MIPLPAGTRMVKRNEVAQRFLKKVECEHCGAVNAFDALECKGCRDPLPKLT